MNKVFFIFISLFTSAYLSADNNTLEKARKKVDNYTSVSFKAKAFYPNPDTDEIDQFTTFYIVNNYNTPNFDFFSKTGSDEELFINGDYTKVLNNDKLEYKFEEIQNQTQNIQGSHLVQYGPTFLLKLNWKYVDDIVVIKEKFSHYSYIQSTTNYNDKTIKVEYNIYISQKNLVSKFERKSFVDEKLGQTVTYEFSDYHFSKKEIDFKYSLPENYNLKYFEKIDLNPLENGTKAPNFVANDIKDRKISENDFVENKTYLLFSSTNCGASKMLYDFMNSSEFKLEDNIKLINFYPLDSKEIVEKSLVSGKKLPGRTF